MRDRPSKVRRPGSSRSSDGSGVRIKGRDRLSRERRWWNMSRIRGNDTTPTNRREWWLTKLNGNAARDKLHQRALRKLGWRSIIIWECQTEKAETVERLNRKLADHRHLPSRFHLPAS